MTILIVHDCVTWWWHVFLSMPDVPVLLKLVQVLVIVVVAAPVLPRSPISVVVPSSIHRRLQNKSPAYGGEVEQIQYLVLIKLTKFAVALRLRCCSCKLIF